MSKPEDYVWSWVTGGFKGIFGLIELWLREGVPPTPDVKINLIKIRDRLTEIIERLP
jgi:hypothetical protein